MDLALLVARLFLSAVFLVAGLTKLGDPQGVIQALQDFGLPRWLARPLSLLLIVAEIAIAVALLPIALAWYGACAALALLGVFVVAIGIALARGRQPDCHCFGQLHSAPVGWKTLVRNAILGALAGWLVVRGPLRVGPSLWARWASAGNEQRKIFILAACLVCFLSFRALRRKEPEEPESVADEEGVALESESDEEAANVGKLPSGRGVQTAAAPKRAPYNAELQRILLAGTGLPVGTRAPEFALPLITGEICSLQSLREQGKTVCLIFSSPFCESCQALVPHIHNWMSEHDRSLNIVLVSRGSAAENLAKLKNLEVSRVLLQQDFEYSESYGVTATPAAVLIGTDGLIQSQLAVGRDDIKQLISSYVNGIDGVGTSADAAR